MATATTPLSEIIRQIPGYDPHATAGDAWFDDECAQNAIDFFGHEETGCLRHIEGVVAGQLFRLEDWQKAIIANIFGWKRFDSKGRTVRRYREVLIYIPRKNGKTPMAAGIGVLVTFCDSEIGQQNYIAAAERGQAGKLFRYCKGMIEAEPELSSRCTLYGGHAEAGQSRSVVIEATNSFMRVISADAGAQHGGTTHLAIVDELHTQLNRGLVDVLQTSLASENRKQPLAIWLTTADYDRPSICNEKHNYASKVRDGIIEDPAFLPVIYEAAIDDDWTDPETWAKANPNLGVSVSVEYMQRECKRAQDSPEYENTFKRLHLNVKTQQAVKCIPMDRWDACASEIDITALAKREVFAALDIGATSDFTALALVFPHDDSQPVQVPVDPEDLDGPKTTVVRRSFTLLPGFWLPESPVTRDPRMQATINTWQRQGFIRTTPGDVVDYDLVLADVLTILRPFQLAGFAFDRGFQGSQMGNNLMKHFGDKVEQFPQGLLSMAAPFRELIELLKTGKLHHDGNPVMRWMASNTAAETRGGLTKPSKDKSAEKIDGITAATMAIGLAIRAPVKPKSVYSTRGIRMI